MSCWQVSFVAQQPWIVNDTVRTYFLFPELGDAPASIAVTMAAF